MMTLFAKDGSCKIVPHLSFPATGLGCVTRIYTPDAVFVVDDDEGLALRETYGRSAEQLEERMGMSLRRAS